LGQYLKGHETQVWANFINYLTENSHENVAEQVTKIKTEALCILEVQDGTVWRTYQNAGVEISCVEAAYFGTSIKH